MRHEDPAFFIEDGRTSVEFQRRISGAEQSTHLSGRRINLRGEHVDRHRADTLVALPVEGSLQYISPVWASACNSRACSSNVRFVAIIVHPVIVRSWIRLRSGIAA